MSLRSTVAPGLCARGSCLRARHRSAAVSPARARSPGQRPLKPNICSYFGLRNGCESVSHSQSRSPLPRSPCLTNKRFMNTLVMFMNIVNKKSRRWNLARRLIFMNISIRPSSARSSSAVADKNAVHDVNYGIESLGKIASRCRSTV